VTESDQTWAGVDGELPLQVMVDNRRNRDSYAAFPEKIANDYRSEQEVYQGDYSRRQVFELIQNGSDAIAEAGEAFTGRVHVLLTETGLYCANEGSPFSAAGINSLRFQLWSSKMRNQIGRFGRGFKSVLALTDQPRIVSRSGSFVFSRRRTKGFLLADSRITLDHLGGGEEVPILAIAEPIDPSSAASDDADLAELMEWATTIIHLPFSSGGRFAGSPPTHRFNLIENDLSNFEPEFLIFAKHVELLTLEVRGARVAPRQYTCSIEPIPQSSALLDVLLSDCSISDGAQEPRRWTLLEPAPIQIQDAVDGLSINRRRNDHGELLPVPIAWAVPASPAQLGRFWSFFPTKDETSLRGILNAPWDTNTERTKLIDTSYNKHLVSCFAALILDAIPFLKDRESSDPGAYLEYLPARGREERNVPAEWIAAAVNEGAAQRYTLPDLDGVMRLPGELRRPPDGVPVQLQLRWSDSPTAPRDFVNPFVADPDRAVRQARMRLYMEAASADNTVQLCDWLALLVSPGDIAASIHAIELARLLAEFNPAMKDRVQGSTIVMLTDGGFGPCDSGAIYLPPPSGDTPADVPTVHPAIAADERSRDTLVRIFGVREVDDAAALEQLVSAWPSEASDDDWRRLWSVAGSIASESAASALTARLDGDWIRFRTASGNWQVRTSVLLVGEIIQPGDADAAFTVDEEFHAPTMALLRQLGVSDVPASAGGNGQWISDYNSYVRDSLSAAGIPVRSIERLLAAPPECPSHLGLLPRLSPDAAARLCNWAARLPNALVPRNLDGTDVDPPIRWLLRTVGTFVTSQGPAPFGSCLAGTTEGLGRVFPVVALPEGISSALGFRDQARDLPDEVLLAALSRLANETDDTLVGLSLAAMATKLPAPEAVPCRRGASTTLLPPAQILVVSDRTLFNDIVRTGSPAVLAPSEDAAVHLVRSWGAKGREAVEETFVYEAADAPALLTDTFFLLGEMHGSRVSHVRYQHCVRISRVVKSADGRTETPVEMGIDSDLLLVAAGTDQPVRVLLAASELLGLRLSEPEIEAILANKRSAEIESMVEEVRRQSDDEARVRALLPVRVLRKLLPAALIDELGSGIDDAEQCARLALAVHGTQLLSEARTDLEQMGLQPPRAWAGSAVAVRFVRDLGFDSSFAGFSRGDRTPEFKAPGPTDLKPLHAYQHQLVDDVKELVRSRRTMKEGGWRGLVFLPTGAGKTRVAVQALVELVEAGHLRKKVVLWIAQTDELCEQAVQAFREVWGALGKSGDLAIGRLWDSNSVTSADETTDDWSAQVIVATISKLTTSVVGNTSYEWLRNAAVIVADEAHQADSPEYTRALRWLGTGVRQKGADQRPLIGLTATPFKAGPQATRRLQGRFGSKLLQIERPAETEPENWSVTAFLRDLGVLARANHQVLEGAEVHMADDELREYNATEPKGRAPWLPTAVEGRIAVDPRRNETLVNSIAALPGDWPVIVFAISVTHAQLLAAQLKLRNIEAAAVSSSTAPGARHHYIKRFRRGEIQVITNYGVLTTGFDAPETRAIYIARPTFSESLYMQMIGRGLRGPLNGGKDECLIVDIRDNIERFEGAFAYDQVGYLWGAQGLEESMDAAEWAATRADDTVELE
jgi:superfamily II DNA or RNA helicase